MLALTALLVLALAASGSFTLAEVALFSLREARMRTLLEEGFRGGPALRALRDRPEQLLVLLRFGKVGADASAGVAAGLLGFLLLGSWGVLLALLLAALLLLLAGHLLPVHLALANNVRLALGIAPATLLVVRWLGPVLGLLGPLVRGLPERPVPGVAAEAEEEIRRLAELGQDEGVIEEEERQLIERAFRLDETRARDIMTPRVDIFAWPDSRTLREIARELQTVPYSRVPVYGDSIDDITGVLYIRDAYQALLAGQRDVALGALSREPLIVPTSIPLTQLLKDFQGRRIHLAVVVDEYGGTDGLVTLEDVLEELVGEIVDETDIAEEAIVRLSRTEILAAGDADLREINHFFNSSFPLLEHRSLNGYLLDELGRVPGPGERLVREGIEIEILEASETQVHRARMERAVPPTAATGPSPVGEAMRSGEPGEDARGSAAPPRAERGPREQAPERSSPRG